MGKESSDEALVARIRSFQRSNKANKSCVDCGELGPTYVCTTFDTFVCTTCSGIHREYNHKVKGIAISRWTNDEVTALEASGGNETSTKKYLKNFDAARDPLPNSSDLPALRNHLKQKYLQQRWKAQDDESSENETTSKKKESKRLSKTSHTKDRDRESDSVRKGEGSRHHSHHKQSRKSKVDNAGSFIEAPDDPFAPAATNAANKDNSDWCDFTNAGAIAAVGQGMAAVSSADPSDNNISGGIGTSLSSLCTDPVEWLSQPDQVKPKAQDPFAELQQQHSLGQQPGVHAPHCSQVGSAAFGERQGAAPQQFVVPPVSGLTSGIPSALGGPMSCGAPMMSSFQGMSASFDMTSPQGALSGFGHPQQSGGSFNPTQKPQIAFLQPLSTTMNQSNPNSATHGMVMTPGQASAGMYSGHNPLQQVMHQWSAPPTCIQTAQGLPHLQPGPSLSSSSTSDPSCMQQPKKNRDDLFSDLISEFNKASLRTPAAMSSVGGPPDQSATSSAAPSSHDTGDFPPATTDTLVDSVEAAEKRNDRPLMASAIPPATKASGDSGGDLLDFL